LDGYGEIADEVRDLESFSKLEVDIAADVVVHMGEFPKISIKTHENLLGKIKTKVRGNTLVIKSNQCIGNTDVLQIDLVVTDLNAISVSGSAVVKTEKQLTADDFDLEVSGSGEIIADIFSNTLETEINGSGKIIVSGTTKNLDISINGSGKVKALGLQAYKTYVQINGSGDVRINSKNRLDVEINGSGSVKYSGNPKLKTDISGSGEVRKLD